jgi:hypothetical protein
MRRRALLLGALALAVASFLLANQAPGQRRFDLGVWDRAFLADVNQVYPPATMSGPVRHPDMSVEVTEFVGRLTRRRAEIHLPYHALRTPVELDIRCHRFGLGGTVLIEVNGRFRDEAEFSDRSYPWAGVRLTVPQEFAQLGPLRIVFEVIGGQPPGVNLPRDFGIGIDRIDVQALSKDAWFLPAPSQLGWFVLSLGVVAGLCRQARLGSVPFAIVVAASGILLSVCAAWFPVWTAALLPYAWCPFPLLAYVLWIHRLAQHHPLSQPGGDPVVAENARQPGR